MLYSAYKKIYVFFFKNMLIISLVQPNSLWAKFWSFEETKRLVKPPLFMISPPATLTMKYFIKRLYIMAKIWNNSKDVIKTKFYLNLDHITNKSPSLVICTLYVLKIETHCKVEEFNNTYIVTNDTRCNGVTNYACASGYNLTSGNLSRLCGTGLEWIGDPPFCSGKNLLII